MPGVEYITSGWICAVAAVICGKWAMELGFRQSVQVLWMVAGFVLPPVALLALYVRLARRSPMEGKPAGCW